MKRLTLARHIVWLLAAPIIALSATNPAKIEKAEGGGADEADEMLLGPLAYQDGGVDTERLMVRPAWVEGDPGFAATERNTPEQVRRLTARARSRAVNMDYPGARRDFQRALRITEAQMGSRNPVAWGILVTAEWVAEEQEDWAAARADIDAALSTMEPNDQSASAWRLLFLWRLAGVLVRTSETGRARDVLDQAADLVALRGDRAEDRAALLNNRGVMHLVDGEWRKAVESLEAALEAAKNVEFVQHQILSNLGLAAWYSGDASGAIRQFLKVRATRYNWAPPDARQIPQLSASVLLVRNQVELEELSAILSVESQLPPESNRIGADIVLARKAELFDREVRAAAARASTGAPESEGPVSAQAIAHDAIANNAALLELVVYQPLARTPPKAADANGLLPPHYAAFVIRAAREPVFVDLGPSETIDRLVVAIRREVTRPTSLERARAVGRQLDEKLIQPLRAAIGGGVTELLIAPESQLNLVPFAALVDREGSFLVERYAINHLSSGRDLLRKHSGPASREPPLVVVNPTFASIQTQVLPAQRATGDIAVRSRDFNGISFTALPGTAEEGAAIAAKIPGARVITGEAATETALKAAHGPRFLHIATHGFFLEEQPLKRIGPPHEDAMLRSGLVFAGVNGLSSGMDDGVLTAREAATLDLAGTQLVVLSACETGIGHVRNGEGVFGLRRSFFIAGAQTLVMTLWEVDDTSTARWMADYYKRLAAGEGRIDAVRQVQLGFLADPQLRHPFYWAPFIGSGQPGPLR